MTTHKLLSNMLDQRKHNDDRMRRAKAWHTRSSQKGTESIERFIFLWISFNAAYGNEKSLNRFGKKPYEKGAFGIFLEKVIRQDTGELKEIFEEDYLESVKTFLENPCIFDEFWSSINNQPEKLYVWKDKHEKENRELMDAWKNKDLKKFLPKVFWRLYELRNQIFHGGTTHPYGVGVRQIQHGTAIMRFLVPKIIGIMCVYIKNHPDSNYWGEVHYPSIEPKLLTSMGISDHEMPHYFQEKSTR